MVIRRQDSMMEDQRDDVKRAILILSGRLSEIREMRSVARWVRQENRSVRATGEESRDENFRTNRSRRTGMNRRGFLRVAAVAFSALLTQGVLPGMAEAYGRRTARRTARRTSRRVSRRRLYTLPAGYSTVAAAGVTYYVVDGVRYTRQMEGGNVVYVEVPQ
jgi:hypothetical protein